MVAGHVEHVHDVTDEVQLGPEVTCGYAAGFVQDKNHIRLLAVAFCEDGEGWEWELGWKWVVVVVV